MFHGLLICLCVSVGHNLDSRLNPTRIAEPIEVPCGVLTQVYYSVLDGGPDPLRKRHFWGRDISEFSVNNDNNNNDRLTAFDPGQPG